MVLIGSSIWGFWGLPDLQAAKGGDSSTTHQDLDHGSFVWETKGYRWAIDLGAESYVQ